jgi:hypothetical protein
MVSGFGLRFDLAKTPFLVAVCAFLYRFISTIPGLVVCIMQLLAKPSPAHFFEQCLNRSKTFLIQPIMNVA